MSNSEKKLSNCKIFYARDCAVISRRRGGGRNGGHNVKLNSERGGVGGM